MSVNDPFDMTQAALDPQAHAQMMGQYGGQDREMLARFFMEAVLDREASEQEGRPVHKDVLYIEMRAPGQHDPCVRRAIREEDKIRFRSQYEHYLKNEEMPETGTPLEEWPLIGRALAEDLKYLSIRTVEALAQTSDANLSNVMGGMTWKQKAKDWLQSAEGSSAPVERLRADNEKLRAELEALRDSMAGQAELIKELQSAPPKRGPGRPRKDQTEA